jgi:hypothetical protein
MTARSVDEGRIRKRIAEIDQHISVLLKERDELLFAERILERLREAEGKAPAAASQPAIVHEAPAPEPDSIEEALLKLESKQFSIQR